MFELTQTAELAHWRGGDDDAAWRHFVDDVKRFVGPCAGVAAAPPPPASGPAILVLPFVNRSGENDQDYFSDGVSEDIITDLGKIAGLSVVSRHTAFAVKNKAATSAELAAALKVTHILEGSVRKQGARVRITAQLLDARTDIALWSERYDRTLDDIFAIQDEISAAIVGALKVRLAADEKKALDARSTASSEAYELFLMARRFSRTGSERMQPITARICRRVLDLDPKFARAAALLSFAESEMAQRGLKDSSTERARDAAERAIALDPDLAEGHAALAEHLARSDAMDLGAGAPHVATALRLDPNCYEAHLINGYLRLGARQFHAAIESFEEAARLDENAYRPLGMALQCYDAIGDRAGLEDAARRTVVRCERLLAIEPDHSGALGFFTSALADLGERDRARRWANWALLFDEDNIRMQYNVACCLAGMDEADKEKATEILERVTAVVTAGWLKWMDTDSSLDPVRDRPRFKAMMARAKARFAATGGP
jgi:adenylate cyclase